MAEKLLSDTKVRQAKGPALLHDGSGLYLEIDDNGNKRWVLRLTLAGKRTRRGIGSYPGVALALARERAEAQRSAAQRGEPVPTRKRNPEATAEPTGPLTFRAAFEKHFAEHVERTLDVDYRVSYVNAVKDYLYPAIGDRLVAEVTPGEMIDALRPVWSRANARARKVLGRARRVFAWTIAMEYRAMANPCEGLADILGKARPPVEHRAAIPWSQAPAFLTWLHERPRASPGTRLCLEMILYTLLRSEEARLAKWGEFDLDAAEWTVPGFDPVESQRLGHPKKRMKSGTYHIVPLSSAAISVLERAKALRRSDDPDALVFPSERGLVLSDNTLSKLLRDAGIPGTPHGLRSTFKDWSAENGVQDEVSEAVLAHIDGNKVRAAYRRTSFLDQRKALMQRWADFLLTGTTKAAPE